MPDRPAEDFVRAAEARLRLVVGLYEGGGRLPFADRYIELANVAMLAWSAGIDLISVHMLLNGERGLGTSASRRRYLLNRIVPANGQLRLEIGWRGLLRLHNFQHNLDLSQAVFAASCRDSNPDDRGIERYSPHRAASPIGRLRLARRGELGQTGPAPALRRRPEGALRRRLGPVSDKSPLLGRLWGPGVRAGLWHLPEPLGDLAESGVAGSAVPHEPAADHSARSAHSAPAVDVDRLAVLQGVVDSVQGRGHLLRTARNAQIPYRAALVLNAQAAAFGLLLGNGRVRLKSVP